jgi:glycosyltransferase involved in cell wall biosynthesis
MKLSIGILAYNESDSIAILLKSLCQQSLLTSLNKGFLIEIIVVPNGCSDNTASIARDTLKLLSKNEQALWNWKVCEVKEAGKSNAWNLFIHQFAAPDADFFCLMDADIQLHDRNTLEKMLKVLVENPEYWIALDQPIKDIELKENKSWLDKLSLAVSKSSNAGQLYICGQLYCGRAEPLRNIWMPAGLPVEDGFLTQMVISENFTIEDPTFAKRIVRVAEASHVFEAYTNPFKLINHEVRVVVGIVINAFLTCYLQEKLYPKGVLKDSLSVTEQYTISEGVSFRTRVQCALALAAPREGASSGGSTNLTAGMLINKWNQENPLWLNDFVRNSLTKERRWLIPISLVFRRYRSLRNHSLWKALLRMPIATLAFMVDISIFIRANSTLHRKVITNYW